MSAKIEIQKGGKYVLVYGGWGQQGNMTKQDHISIEMPSGQIAESAAFQDGKVVVTMESGEVRAYEHSHYSKVIKQGGSKSKKQKEDRNISIEAPKIHRQKKEKQTDESEKSFWHPWWAIPFKLIWLIVKGIWWVLKNLAKKS